MGRNNLITIWNVPTYTALLQYNIFFLNYAKKNLKYIIIWIK